jgi:hypothetical protein
MIDALRLATRYSTEQGYLGMRVLMLLTAMVVVGCASQPGAPTKPRAAPATASAPDPALASTPASAAPAPAAAAAPYNSPSGAAAPTADVEAQRLAAAKNLNLKVMSKDGQQLFCRSNLVTGSHISRDTRCYTAEQLDRMQEQTQRDLEQSYIRPPFSTTPGKGILSQ